MGWRRILAWGGIGLVLAAGLPRFSAAEDRETAFPSSSSPFPDLHRGDRIRVRLRSNDSFRARFVDASLDTLVYASWKRSSDERRLSFTAIEGIDRRDGSRGHWAAGALLGLVGGAAIGALISTSEEGNTEPGIVALIYALGGAAGGLVVGSAIGASIRSDRWTPVIER